MGTQNDDGFELSATIQGQEINQSDAYGMTLMEAIYRGQNWKMRCRGLEWASEGMTGALQMFGGAGGIAALDLAPILQNVGDRWSKYGQTLLMTAILGNPPSVPQSLTAMSACLSPNSQSSFLFTSKMREFPLEFVLLPYAHVVSGVTTVVPFTST